MRRLITTIRNIFRIPELRQRILYTLALLAVYRAASFVILPGIDSRVLEEEFARTQGMGILGMLNAFVGGAFSRGSILALGIMPYISASIIIQLMTAAVPSLQKLQKEGESGQQKLNQWTKYLTVAVVLMQGTGYLVNLQSQYSRAITLSSGTFTFVALLCMLAGTLFLVWLADKITEKGLGNGSSLIITIGIVAEFVPAVSNEFLASAPMIFYAEFVALIVVIMGVVLLQQAVRKIPVHYARQMMAGGRLPQMSGGVGSVSHIPLKVNAAGVMPIIFAQSFLFLPASVATYFPESSFWTAAGSWFADYTSFAHNLLLILLIVIFTYFYTAIAINPRDISDQLKRAGGYIPGIKPGKPTADFIDAVLTRITLPGALALGVVAILPAIMRLLGTSNQFAQFFGGTSILIIVGTVLDTLQQIESYLLMRHYEGLVKTGRIQGRSPISMIAPR
ncbi:MAG: preprotein translocase subunit SecY [Bacteroidia bacterium]